MSQAKPSVSVVVTTYRWPEAIREVLRGLARQTDPDFETVVGDDGSDDATVAALRSVADRLAGGLVHVWQPDRGFRAAAIRNRAIAAARGDYLVFLDGDSIPRRGFVAAHRSAARVGWAMRGRRALLSPGLSARTLAGESDPASAGLPELLRHRVTGDLNRIGPFLPLLRPIRDAFGVGLPWTHVRTVNFAAWRRDLERVNGFDERYVGWGSEDSDLAIRLGHAGVRIGGLSGAATVLHLHHPGADRSNAAANRERLRAVERSAAVRAEPGLDRIDGEVRVERLS